MHLLSRQQAAAVLLFTPVAGDDTALTIMIQVFPCFSWSSCITGFQLIAIAQRTFASTLLCGVHLFSMRGWSWSIFLLLISLLLLGHSRLIQGYRFPSRFLSGTWCLVLLVCNCVLSLPH